MRPPAMRLARGHFAAFVELLGLVRRHHDLIIELARREVADRYAGQAFGMAWAIGHPLFLTGLYVFIFAVVFKTRIGGTVEMPRDYTVYILSGLVAWSGFQESLVKSCTAITSNVSLVKQVVFPFEVLPLKGVLVSFLPQAVSLAILILYVLATSGGRLPATYVLLPVLIVTQAMAMVGMAYLLSAVGVYFRDIKDVVQVFATVGVYLIPAFYLPNWVPDLVRPLLYLNPFSYVIWCYQDALYYGRFEHPWAWLVAPVSSLICFVLGYRVFRRLKPSFGSVL